MSYDELRDLVRSSEKYAKKEITFVEFDRIIWVANRFYGESCGYSDGIRRAYLSLDDGAKSTIRPMLSDSIKKRTANAAAMATANLFGKAAGMAVEFSLEAASGEILRNDLFDSNPSASQSRLIRRVRRMFPQPFTKRTRR